MIAIEFTNAKDTTQQIWLEVGKIRTIDKISATNLSKEKCAIYYKKKTFLVAESYDEVLSKLTLVGWKPKLSKKDLLAAEQGNVKRLSEEVKKVSDQLHSKVDVILSQKQKIRSLEEQIETQSRNFYGSSSEKVKSLLNELENQKTGNRDMFNINKMLDSALQAANNQVTERDNKIMLLERSIQRLEKSLTASRILRGDKGFLIEQLNQKIQDLEKANAMLTSAIAKHGVKEFVLKKGYDQIRDYQEDLVSYLRSGRVQRETGDGLIQHLSEDELTPYQKEIIEKAKSNPVIFFIHKKSK